MTRRFLAIGECMIEMAPQSDGRFAMGYAGDTFNTAWYARRSARSDIDVAYFSAVGDDSASDAMTRFMEGEGVRPMMRQRAGRSVGLYMISLENGERSFSYWRGMSAARTLGDDLRDLPVAPGDTAFFSGISLAILPQDGRVNLLKALESARASGVQIAFDPNLRPRLWENEADMRHWVMEGAAVADIALPSFEDEATVFGDADTDGTADRYLDAGASLAVVKDGPRPVRVASGSDRCAIATEPVEEVVDTTAAGDSFNGRFLAGLMAGEAPEDAAHAACDLSRKVICAAGALVAIA